MKHLRHWVPASTHPSAGFVHFLCPLGELAEIGRQNVDCEFFFFFFSTLSSPGAIFTSGEKIVLFLKNFKYIYTDTYLKGYLKRQIHKSEIIPFPGTTV